MAGGQVSLGAGEEAEGWGDGSELFIRSVANAFLEDIVVRRWRGSLSLLSDDESG